MVEQGDPTGIEFPIREMKGSDAERWADAAGVLADLAFVKGALSDLLSQWPSEADQGPDGVIPRALWSSAVVAYARCFAGGMRFFDADAMVDGLGEGARESHQYFLTLRDKHIAHSVNALEQFRVGVLVSEDVHAEVMGSGAFGMIRVLEDRSATNTLLELATRLEAAVAEVIPQLRTAVEAAASALTPQQRNALPIIRLVAPDPSTLSRRRPAR